MNRNNHIEQITTQRIFKMIYIGIDNGATGTIGILKDKNVLLFKGTPTIKVQDYTKKKKTISRLDVNDFRAELEYIKTIYRDEPKLAILERPLVNPQLFNATVVAVRVFEAQLVILECLNIPYMFIDSKKWQRALLPQGTKGTPELKKASEDIGCRLFPQCKDLIMKHKDADGLLIAEYARRQNL